MGLIGVGGCADADGCVAPESLNRGVVVRLVGVGSCVNAAGCVQLESRNRLVVV